MPLTQVGTLGAGGTGADAMRTYKLQGTPRQVAAFCWPCDEEVHDVPVYSQQLPPYDSNDTQSDVVSHLAPGSVDFLFVNHPEPPHQTNVESAMGGEAPHLLTTEFLLALRQLLSPRAA